MKYYVYGSYTVNNIHNQQLLQEYDTLEEAETFARLQIGAWDRVIICYGSEDDYCIVKGIISYAALCGIINMLEWDFLYDAAMALKR